MKRIVGWIVVAAAAACVSARAQGVDTNLVTTVRNTGFEKPSIVAGAQAGDVPEYWFFFCSDSSRNVGLTDARKRSGMQSIVFKSQAVANAHEGMAQKFEARPGKHYTFSVYVMNDPQDPVAEAAYGQINLEWQNICGVEISRTHSSTWNRELSTARWEKYTVDDDAPTNAAIGVAVITLFSQDSAGAGRFFADDCEFSMR